ncbi:5-hydroxytryptamine receptor 1A-beta-like [Mercenaria mercenaria]|uniref:5-hydroxytryptamine receptor 1A-beta-like n=1 Tax=Mercenaria mercenaria TaxID=6596 RepID=UPI00234F717B|nr:5-hydroxytryptamine receptor 1A-beta-like [Mercenaria mercenaria]
MQDSNTKGDDIIYQTQHDIFMRLLPVIVCGAILGAVGIIGNIFAMIFYTTKSKGTTTVNLIISLSVVDFIVCLLVIPNLVEVILNVGNTQRFLCKATHFLSLWTVASSCILLWVISIDRHRRICKPFAKQIKIHAVKYIVASIVIFSFALAIRNLIIYDTVAIEISTSSINNKTTIGYYCTITDDPELKIIVSSFYALDFLLILIAWVTIIVTYSNAIFILMKQRRKMKRQLPKLQHNIKREQSITETSYGTCDADGGSDWNISEDLDVSRGVDEESSYRDDNDKAHTSQDGNHRPAMLTVNPRAHSVCNLSKRNENDIKSYVKLVAVKSVIERNLTIMMFAASIVFILSFTPFFVIRVIMRIYLGTGVDYELKTVIQFALKLPVLNSVFNPVIYCVFNSKFRKFLKCGF